MRVGGGESQLQQETRNGRKTTPSKNGSNGGTVPWYVEPNRRDGPGTRKYNDK